MKKIKPQFLSTLRMELVNDHDKDRFVLLAPLVYLSAVIGGEVVVPAGEKTNLASVPRLPLAYLLAGDTARYPAVVHDYLYSCRDVSRSKADAVFLEAMKVVGVPWWRRGLMWAAVRAGGWTCRKPTRALAPVAAAVLLCLCGCASTWGNRESRVVLPSGEVYRVTAQQDGTLAYRNGDVEIKVDNRGRPSMIEQTLTAPLVGIVGTVGKAANHRLEDDLLR